MVKRILLCVLILVVAFGITACAQKPVENENWVWTGFNNQEGALSDSGYYYVPLDHVLSYAELSGKGSIALCSKTGCSHDSRECDAWVGFFVQGIMFYWNDHIYYLNPETYTLCCRNTTGMEFKEIGVPGEKFLKEQQSVSAGRYAQVGAYLYYSGTVMGQKLDEESGVSVTMPISRYIGRIHLESGKDEILFEKTDVNSNGRLWLLAAKDGEALVIMSEGIDLSAEDPGYTEALYNSPVVLYRWNGQTGQTEEVFRKKYQDCREWQAVFDGKFYYATQASSAAKHRGNVYAFDLTAGKEELVCENGFIEHLGGGYALRKTNDEDGWQLIELKTGKILPADFGSFRPIPCETSEEGLVFSRLVAREIKQEDGSTVTKNEKVYCYIKYASLTDGWQETDIVPLYTQKYNSG